MRLMRERAHRFGLKFPAEAIAQERRVPNADPLTGRQREIARFVADGLTNREIAERLTVSVRTVDSHVEQIRSKLEFHTRAQIAAWVVERYGPLRAN